MYDLRGCRACLNQNCKLERVNDTTRRLYCTITGLDFKPGDCFPCYFCTECSTQIRKILAFRRRCRRAYFVLKEIATVRQKVTLEDLCTVDRKKTNLRSNIDYWSNNNTGFYSVNEVEETGTTSPPNLPSDIREFIKEFEPTSQSDVLVKTYKPEVINNTYITVDIKPDTCEDEVMQKYECTSDGDNNINDDIDGDEVADDNVADIDLEDVFKGLPEEKSDEDSDYGLPELPEPEPEPKPKQNTKKTTVDEDFKNTKKSIYAMQVYQADKLSRTLTDFTLQVLSFEEQIDLFQARKEAEPYKSATFKCSMCLVVFSDMPELLKHVEMHNERQQELTKAQKQRYQCTICKDFFGDQEKLTVHSAHYHWYKYHCNQCKKDQYTLFDTLNCHDSLPSGRASFTKHCTMEELFSMSDMTSHVEVAPMKKNCRLCGRRANGKFLEHHEKSHVEPQKDRMCRRYPPRYQCDRCGLWCRQKDDLANHMHMHYSTFACKQCHVVFQGWNAAHDHLKSHKMLQCMCCGEMFRSYAERKKHQAEHDWELDCNLCGLPMYNLTQFYYHQLAHHGYISVSHESLGDPKYRCGACGVQFVDEASLNRHRAKRDHFEPDKIGGKCQSCKKVFFTVEEFVAHRRGNKVCKRYPVKCVYCHEMLKNYRTSERHYEQAHPTLPNEHQNAMLYTICEYCGKTIAEMHIRAHTKRHTTPGGEPSLTCKFCRAKMFTSRAYVSHILFNHTHKPYICAQCPYRSKYRSECREHILKVHAPERLYACTRCARRFSHLDLLQQHSLRAHALSVKDDRSVYLQMKDLLGKIYVFPHMKIDGSFLHPSVIEDAGLILCDFLGKSQTPVDWKDYYVFGTGVEPTEADPYVHRKRPSKPNKYKKKNCARKPVDENIIKAIEGHSVMTAVNENQGLKRIFESESDGEHDKVKIAKLDETAGYCDVNADVYNVEHEEMVQEYDIPDLQADILGKPSKGDRKKKRSKKKRDKSKPNETVDEVKTIESECFNNDDIVKMAMLEETLDVDKVEHEETVRGYDMPDLQADILGDLPEANKAETLVEETVEEEYIELDMAELLRNHQVVEENGEQYVVMNGTLYRLQVG